MLGGVAIKIVMRCSIALVAIGACLALDDYVIMSPNGSVRTAQLPANPASPATSIDFAVAAQDVLHQQNHDPRADETESVASTRSLEVQRMVEAGDIAVARRQAELREPLLMPGFEELVPVNALQNLPPAAARAHLGVAREVLELCAQHNNILINQLRMELDIRQEERLAQGAERS